MHHIKNTLPEIKLKIDSALLNYKKELNELGEAFGESGAEQMV